MPVGCTPPWPNGERPPVPTHLSPPSCALVLLLQPLEEAAHELVAGERSSAAHCSGVSSGNAFGSFSHSITLSVTSSPNCPSTPLNRRAKTPVVGVEVGLALDQTGAPEMVEAQQAGAVQPLLERAQERLPLLDADRNAFVPQTVEEIEEHAVSDQFTLVSSEAARSHMPMHADEHGVHSTTPPR